MSNTNNNNIMSSSKKTSFISTASPSSVSSRTFSSVGNLIKFLPTGTVFLFSFLNPIVTDNGHCGNSFNKTLAGILISLCGLSCVFASFTDSYVSAADGGAVHYGVVTPSGLWPSSSSGEDLSGLRLRLGDFVHAFFGAAVFAVLSMLDSNTVRCFYPEFESEQKILLQILPPVIGAVAGTVFMVFPNKRHGIGQTPSGGDSGDSDNHRS